MIREMDEFLDPVCKCDMERRIESINGGAMDVWVPKHFEFQDVDGKVEYTDLGASIKKEEIVFPVFRCAKCGETFRGPPETKSEEIVFKDEIADEELDSASGAEEAESQQSGGLVSRLLGI